MTDGSILANKIEEMYKKKDVKGLINALNEKIDMELKRHIIFLLGELKNTQIESNLLYYTNNLISDSIDDNHGLIEMCLKSLVKIKGPNTINHLIKILETFDKNGTGILYEEYIIGEIFETIMAIDNEIGLEKIVRECINVPSIKYMVEPLCTHYFEKLVKNNDIEKLEEYMGNDIYLDLIWQKLAINKEFAIRFLKYVSKRNRTSIRINVTLALYKIYNFTQDEQFKNMLIDMENDPEPEVSSKATELLNILQ